jgi:hypothetical protein
LCVSDDLGAVANNLVARRQFINELLRGLVTGDARLQFLERDRPPHHWPWSSHHCLVLQTAVRRQLIARTAARAHRTLTHTLSSDGARRPPSLLDGSGDDGSVFANARMRFVN